MTRLLTLLTLLLPISQLILGTIAILQFRKWNFNLICLVNLVLCVVFTVAATYHLQQQLEKNEMHCGNPLMGPIAFGLIIFILLLVISIVQSVADWFLKRKSRK